MKGRAISIAVLVGLAIILLGQTLPSVPSAISYQGRLTDGAEGALTDGEYEMTFLVFDALTGGKLLWSETQPGVMVTTGRYRAELGAEEPIGFAVFNSRNAYLEVRVFGESQTPRSRIVSVPFALKAEGEVPEGAIILGEQSGNTAIAGLGYTEQGDTIGLYYLYKKDAYNPSQSRVPRRIAYQGKVGPVDGGTVGAAADFGFTMFDADTGGSMVWSETQDDVPVDGSGLFSVELGTNNPVDPVDLVSKDVWLAVSVNGQTLSPREKLASAAYSLKVISPAPEGAVVLAETNTNTDLVSKKFALIAGTTVDGYYPYRKSAFNPSDPSVPLLVSYQGKLTDVAGDTLSSDTVDIGFRIFDGATAGAVLWSETVPDVGLSSGIFNALLGGGATISPATFPGPDAWIEITVIEGTTSETLSPRQRLASVPFALSAEGMLPASALILSSAADSETLTSSGYQPTGDTVSGYYIYAKTDIDTTPPDLTIVTPIVYSGSSIAATPVLVIYSDSLSGIDTSSFQAFLNGDTVTASFTVTGATATASLTASLGQNILRISISDLAGNSRQRISYFYMDNTGTPPVINITSPVDGTSVGTSTPLIEVEFYDDEGGIDLASLAIEVNGVDRTDRFIIETTGSITRASWRPDAPLPLGVNVALASLKNLVGWFSGDTSQFDVTGSVSSPTITGFTPQFGFEGDTVTITGVGFSSNTVENTVFFAPQRRARVWQASPTQLVVTVPPGALSGNIVLTVAEAHAYSTKPFVIGLRYGFVANYDNINVNPGYPGMVSVIDFDSTNPGAPLDYILCGGRPFDVAVSPDGRRAYASTYTGDTICIIDTARVLDGDTGNDVIGTIGINDPMFLAVSPDGRELYAGSGAFFNVFRNGQKVFESGNLGGTLQDIAVSPLHQLAYATVRTSSNSDGFLYYINIDRARNQPYETSSTGAYFNPYGVGITPDQDEICVANNRSRATGINGSQAYSFSQYFAYISDFVVNKSALIDPSTDAHDVNWPYSLAFDPRGMLMYATFGDGFAGTGSNATTNNVGVKRLPFITQYFQAATLTDAVSPNPSPRGLAVSPGGGFVFAANLGIGAGEGNKITVLDHFKVKQAIAGDAGDSNYNLTGDDPESLDDLNSILEYEDITRPVSGFDGPRNIAFQEFPVIELSPPVLHLALGGVAPGEELFEAQIHPVYGDTVKVGFTDGTSVDMNNDYVSQHAVLHQQWLGVEREVYDLVPGTVQLFGHTAGIGKLVADVNGYPSNVAFVTVPPQKFIQVLFAEGCPSSNEILYRALAAVVKNRIRLTWGHFDNSPIPLDTGAWLSFDFPPVYYEKISDDPPKYVRRNPGGQQITASNASELLADQQIRLAFNSGYPSVGSDRYDQAARRESVPAAEKEKYDLAVQVTGDAMMDLMRTLTNDIEMSTIPQPDPNSLDLLHDPTGGSFSFYSPTTEQWSGGTFADSIAGTLASGSSVFPTTGEFESDFVCGAYFPTFCRPPDHKAYYIQVVVVQGIPVNDCDPPRFGAPQFIFFRFRKRGDRAVISLGE